MVLAGPLALLLSVPYLPQSEALCGGAAVAMVMRYWGATGVYAETFSDLVDTTTNGIRGAALIGALESRGWDARSFRGDAAVVQARLTDGQPVVTLIEDRPGAFHYVVVVGWVGDRVVVHDPARAPYRVLDAAAFTTAWERSGYWTMLAVPGNSVRLKADTTAAVRLKPDTTAGPEACDGLVDEGVRLAEFGDLDGARATLDVAAESCPRSPAPWRERAGLHAVSGDWAAAAADAAHAVARDPSDQHAWRLLATSRYLRGDAIGALDAWNRVGEPSIDLVNINGLERTRFKVVADAMGLAPKQTLTPDVLATAERRLADLPAAQVAKVRYHPAENGLAQVDATIIERERWPTSRLAVAATAAHVLTDCELTTTIASPSGGGEAWSASWRWWEPRPLLRGSFSTPAPTGGVWTVEGFWERQTYRAPLADLREDRRGVTLTASTWTSAGTRWAATAGVDQWSSIGRTASLASQVEQRVAGDRVALTASVGLWTGAFRTWTTSVGGEWRSAPQHLGTVALARAGFAAAGANAPLAFWPGAGTGQGRSSLLRAHPLLDDGVVADGVFGRRLATAGAEVRRWRRVKLIPVAPGAFVDAAKAARSKEGFDTRTHVDIGGGLRVALPGSGVLRIDLARGIRDGATAFSVGWTK